MKKNLKDTNDKDGNEEIIKKYNYDKLIEKPLTRDIINE